MSEKNHKEKDKCWLVRDWRKMKPFERWTLIFQILAFIVGLGIVWQLWQGWTEIQDSKYVSANSWTIDLDKAFVDNPKLRPYFYENVAVTTNDPNYEQVMAMSEYMLDTLDSFVNHRFVKEKKPVQQSWKNWMFFCFSNSPALRYYMTNHIDWYNKDGALYDTVYTEWSNNYYAGKPASGNNTANNSAKTTSP